MNGSNRLRIFLDPCAQDVVSPYVVVLQGVETGRIHESPVERAASQQLCGNAEILVLRQTPVGNVEAHALLLPDIREILDRRKTSLYEEVAFFALV